MKFLDYNGLFISFFVKVKDLIILNLLILVFCLPVITCGAAITAGHYAALRLRRHEGHVTLDFWKSFRENFIQATLLWIVLLLNIAVAFYAIRIAMSMGGLPATIILTVLAIMLILTVLGCMWLFPLQSRFCNAMKATIQNALFFAIRYLPRTLYMLIVTTIPFLLAETMTLNWFLCLFLLFGISLPIYCNVMVYDKLFEQHETE